MNGPVAPEWATSVTGRSPEFKIHNTYSAARLALLSTNSWRNRWPRILWHWEGDDWVEHEMHTERQR